MHNLFSFEVVRNTSELHGRNNLIIYDQITCMHVVSHAYHFLRFFYDPHLGYKEEDFSWPSYLKACKAQAAPKSLFENQNAVSPHLLLMVWKVACTLMCVVQHISVIADLRPEI